MIFFRWSKKIIIPFLVLILTFSIFFYFVATQTAYDHNIYFNPTLAVQNFGLKSDEILFEFSDDIFYVAFDNNKNIKSSRKDFLFWVRSKFDSFFEDSVNEIYTVTVKDTVYVYGVTYEKGAKKVKLVDCLLNEANAEFKGSFVSSLNAMCFCLKINKKDLLLAPYSLEVTDDNNDIIPRKLTANEKALSIADKILNAHPKTTIFNVENQETYSKTLKLKTNERLYLILDKDEYFLQTHTDFVEFYFYNDYVLLTKKLNIFTKQNSAHAKTNSMSYCKTYKLNYTSELQELRQSRDGKVLGKK